MPLRICFTFVWTQLPVFGNTTLDTGSTCIKVSAMVFPYKFCNRLLSRLNFILLILLSLWHVVFILGTLARYKRDAADSTLSVKQQVCFILLQLAKLMEKQQFVTAHTQAMLAVCSHKLTFTHNVCINETEQNLTFAVIGSNHSLFVEVKPAI